MIARGTGGLFLDPIKNIITRMELDRNAGAR
jgi:hypothetical protein